ncbi:carbohydrate kinase [uncultured Shewanella sp.]|uniref:carbohydrate kinase family protein n=1 Tax=uncultured Shewanella sp. TaxID=173975 RepID=UPI002636AA27|nr:carbohydrate kinase [uncultured Shewanella sp.]
MAALFCFGEILIDLLPSDDDSSVLLPIAGGAPANVAVGFSKLGGVSYFAGGISQDNFGCMLKETLQKYGVKTDYLADIEDAFTAKVEVVLDNKGERTFHFDRENTADLCFTQAHFDVVNWSKVDIFHFCSNTLTHENILQASLYGLALARQSGLLVSFDVNLRQQLWQDMTALSVSVEQCYPFTHVLKMSLEEVDFLAQLKSVERQVYFDFCFTQGVKAILVTDGANAVDIITPTFVFQVPVPQIAAVDTTCGGDSFVAGFWFALTAGLSHSKANKISCKALSLEMFNDEELMHQAVVFAVQCGVRTCMQKGAFPALPCLDEVMSLY